MSKNLINKLYAVLDSGELFSFVDESLAVVQVLEKIGFSNKGQYVQIVRQFLFDNEIDTSHFTPNGRPLVPKITKVCPVCSSEFKTEPRNEKEQVTCSRACSNTYFRTRDGASTYRDRALKYYGAKCFSCNFTNLLALEVHHKDKNRDNNSIENLVVLCANCHRITHGSE
jgi:hypothetical protein